LRHALLASLLVLSSSAVFADGPPRDPYIQVSGHGELHVAPDMAYVSLTLEKTDLDAKAARTEVEGRAAKVIALARKLGLSDKDIEAPAVTVYPEYQCVRSSLSSGACVNKLTGQHVSRAITLTLRDLARYGDLVDGLFGVGVTDLGGVTFDRSDRRALESQARTLAVQDAHDKASGLAKSAGVDLGAVFSIAEQGSGYAPRPMMMAAAVEKSSAEPEYLNGRIDVGADVQVYYLISK
jgi:uncharacterized protein YggE